MIAMITRLPGSRMNYAAISIIITGNKGVSKQHDKIGMIVTITNPPKPNRLTQAWSQEKPANRQFCFGLPDLCFARILS